MTRPHIVTPAELSSLRDLELFARTTVEGLRQGLHRSPFHGYSAEFSQYRHYRPGDDLKYVDWKAFGRSDRLYSRQFRESTNMGALLVLDASRSMDYPSPDVGPSKFALACATAAVLAALVVDQGDAAGLIALGDRTTYLPARSGRHHLHACFGALARLTPSGTEGVAPALRRAASLLTRRGIVIVVGDFYDEEPAVQEITRLHRMGHEVIAIHVLAREEVALPGGGAVELEDLETGATVITNATAVRDAYRRSVEAFMTRVERAVTREGLDYVRLITGEPLEPPLRRFLIGRRGGE